MTGQDIPHAATPTTTWTVSERLAADFPPPADWQDFQRKCVVLFQYELGDPNAQEYGRGGQKQRGIDILGKRGGSPTKYVGVQCRRVVKPLTEAKIMADCRAALAVKAGLTEIIFATTAPNDTKATDAATAVEKILRKEGHEISISIYGWVALRNKIALHETAFAVFFPSAAAGSLAKVQLANQDELIEQITASVQRVLAPADATTPAIAAEPSAEDMKSEDPALHAKIDVFADLIKQGQSKLAEAGLNALLSDGSVAARPWANYRVVANLGSAAMDLGRDDEAAQRYAEAHDLRPDFPKAIALLATARTIQGRYDEAMALAQQALSATPRADHAVSHLLQAAARSDWEGDPEALIPEDLRGTPDADLGLAEFLRRRDFAGWERRCIALAAAHPDVEALRNVSAIAVLSLALGKDDVIGMGGDPSLSQEEIDNAATFLKRHADRLIDIGYADRHDLLAYVNNAAVMLRVADRDPEAIALIRKLGEVSETETHIVRLLALCLAAEGRRPEAIEELKRIPGDVEGQLLCAELIADAGDRAGAIDVLRALRVGDGKLARIRLRIMGEIATHQKDQEALAESADGLRALDVEDPIADLLDASLQTLRGDPEEKVHETAMRALTRVSAETDVSTRYAVAEALSRLGLYASAADLLEGHVNLQRHGAATFLYLQSLAAARRDQAFSRALKQASDNVHDDLAVLRLVAEHSWNTGNLRECERAICSALSRSPPPMWARNLQLELLVREDRSSELIELLKQPLEHAAWSLTDRYRIAALLAHFGFPERAAKLAYRTYLTNRDDSRAWMSLSTVVLKEGFDSGADRLWAMPAVAEEAGVDIEYEDEIAAFIILEPDPTLRNLDSDSIEPAHPLAQAVFGLAEGAEFKGPDGRGGKVTRVRHKYVARLHYVMEEHQHRFPSVIGGFRAIRVDPTSDNGLDEFKAQLRQHSEWIEEQRALWLNSPWPLAWLAQRIGVDEIDLAVGLASEGHKLRVADGNQNETDQANVAIRAARNGCVLDIIAFWTAWRLKALEAVERTCGRITVARSVLDQLRRRREMLQFNARSGAMRTAGYKNGKVLLEETSADLINQVADDVGAAIDWLETSADIAPVVIAETLHPSIADVVKSDRTRMFDAIAVAHERNLLLISDDRALRQAALATQDVPSGWSNQVYRIALARGHIDLSTYTRWAASLVDAGHNYIGVNGATIVEALRLDLEETGAVGRYYSRLAGRLGGANAEQGSHIEASVESLVGIWNAEELFNVRQAATSILLRNLLRERHEDYHEIFVGLFKRLSEFRAIQEYMRGWAKGHFLVS